MTLLAPEPVVTPETLRDSLSTVTVVDVRDARDYSEVGHVPGAVNVPVDAVRDSGDDAAGMLPDPDAFSAVLGDVGIEPDDPLVAYDESGGVNAARFLLTAGLCGHRGSLSLLDGDFTVWQGVGPTSRADPDPAPTIYDASPPAETPLVSRDAVRDAMDGDAILVDTRTPGEFDQSHLPGAVQLGWETLLDDETGRLLPREDLEDVLSERGIRRDREVVLYCNTARRLSHTYVVLQSLGFDDVRFYEGNLTDWIRAESPAWDPVGLQERVRDLAPEGLDAVVAELGDDVFNRLKLIGLYAQKQDGYFMLRTKVPGGILTAEQTRVIGDVADEFARAPDAAGGSDQNSIFGDRYLDVTTRQDVQMHWVRIEDMPEIWDRYEQVGLTTLQACGNSVRNVVGCPAAGIERNETIDAQPIAEDVTEHFLGDRRYGNLPRKLKVSVTGCSENCARAHINDLGFTPAVKDGRDGFHVLIGGGLSDGPRVASDLDIFLEPPQVVDLVEATADIFIEYGNYLDTAVNRLRFVVDHLGVDRVRDELEARVDFDLETGGESLTTDYRGDHVGVHEQEDGRYYVGLNVTAGRMGGADFAALADLAQAYGDGEVRLTLNQNVLLPHVPCEQVDDLIAEPLVEQYSPDPGPFSRGIVTCTGKEFCSYGIIETKNRAVRWARQLDDWATDQFEDPPDVVRIHMSGCSASCAQPQLGDIGLRGETYRDEDGSKPAVDVGLGGDLGREQFADWIETEVPVDTLPDAVERLVAASEADGADGDFAGWVNGQSRADLATLVTGEGS